MDRTKVYVLGVGFEGRQGLPQGAAGLIERAEVLYGGKRLLSLFQDHPADKVAIGGDIQAAIQAVHASVGKSVRSCWHRAIRSFLGSRKA